MTPLHIQLAIHYYAIAERYAKDNPGHARSPAVRQYTRELVAAGMIVPDPAEPSGYRATAGLRMYVEALKSVPLPTLGLQWSMPGVEPVPGDWSDLMTSDDQTKTKNPDDIAAALHRAAYAESVRDGVMACNGVGVCTYPQCDCKDADPEFSKTKIKTVAPTEHDDRIVIQYLNMDCHCKGGCECAKTYDLNRVRRCGDFLAMSPDPIEWARQMREAM